MVLNIYSSMILEYSFCICNIFIEFMLYNFQHSSEELYDKYPNTAYMLQVIFWGGRLET